MVRVLGHFLERNAFWGRFRSGKRVVSRTEYYSFGNWFGFRGDFPNGMPFGGGFVRERGQFPEQSIIYSAVGSGFGVISRTECLFEENWFGKEGGFPNKVSFLRLLVRVSGHFPEQNAFLGKVCSGKRVVSRTE